MRRLFFFLIILSLAFSASACSARTTPSVPGTSTPEGREGLIPTGTTRSQTSPTAVQGKPGGPGEALSAAAPTRTPIPTPTAAGPLPTIPAPANAAAPDIASYQINVTLDPRQHTLDGRQVLTYRNATQKPMPDVVLHLYLNAFKSKDTIFMKESGGQLRGYSFDPESAGWIDVPSIRLQGGAPLALEILEDGTLARVTLPQPVAPGETVRLEMDFQARLPKIFARTGWVLDQAGEPFFLVAQWFPKAGVWSDDGWRADPFHGNAEFFADFGSYDVSITLPAGYTTGASGLPVKTTKNGANQTVNYRAEGVIDFAWVASQHLETASRKLGDKELVYLYLKEHAWSVERTFEAASLAVERFSDWIGPYPYTRLTIVDVPEQGAGAGGMEYPTFITVGANASEKSSGPMGWDDYFAVVTVHEVAHQWFQSMIATDEGREPWLDEGFADYATARLFIQEFGLPFTDKERTALDAGFLQGRRNAFLRNPDVAMEATAWEYDYGDYVIASYAKPDMALLTLENLLGEDTMLAILRSYYARYRYGHPSTADFQQVAEQVSGQQLDWFFQGLVYKDAMVNYTAKSMQGDSVVVTRSGTINVPVDVLITLKGGTTQTVPCQPMKDTCTFQFTQPVQSVMVDPERHLLIDTNWEDNQLPRPGAQ